MPNHDLARWQDERDEALHDALIHAEYATLIGRQIHDATEVRMSDTWMPHSERHGRQMRGTPQGSGQGTDRAATVEALVLDGTLESTKQGVPQSASTLC